MATRVCPECGSQYVASVRTCIDCDVALIDEVDPAAPERTATAPKAAGEQVAYELPGWGNPLKVSLEGMLDRAGIRRAWESGALVVPAEFEAEVDRLVATVEGGDVGTLDDDVPQVAFEIEGLGADELADLDARLIAAHLAHAWDDEGALLVAESDEQEVAEIVEHVLDGAADDDGLDGLAVQQALSELYVAVDKLMKDPDDAKDRSRFLDAAGAVGDLPVPYGLSGVDWGRLVGDVEALATELRPSSSSADDVDDADADADAVDDADADADDVDPDDIDDQDGDESEGHDGTDGVGETDHDDDVAEADADGPSIAEQARSLRGRLHELV